MSKLENYLKEYLKIVPEIQIKVKNKMDVIYKDDSIYLSNKKKVAKKIKHNLGIIEEKALSKNNSLNKLRSWTQKSEMQKEEEERKKRFNFKMNQIAEDVSSSDSSSSSDDDSDLDESDSEEEEILNNRIRLTPNTARTSVGFKPNVKHDGMYAQIEEMFGYKNKY